MFDALLRSIAHPHEFKLLCDGLLRAEYQGLVSTFGGGGADRGVDAMMTGAMGDVQGRWIFQYKFASEPTVDQARRRVLGYFRPSARRPSEFSKARGHSPVGYVLLTNVALTVHNHIELEELAGEHLPGVRFVAWDSSALVAMLRGREYLGQVLSSAKHAAAREVAASAFAWLDQTSYRASRRNEEPMWPLELEFATEMERGDSVIMPVRETTRWRADLVDNSVLATMQLPLFDLASTILFPNAFSFLAGVVDAINELLEAVRDRTFALSRRLAVEEPVIRNCRVVGETVESLPLAFAVLRAAWGEAPGIVQLVPNPTGSGDTIRVQGSVAYVGKSAPEIQAALDRELSARRGQADAHLIYSLRSRVSETVGLGLTALWYPAELGIDAPEPYRRSMKPAPMPGLPEYEASDAVEEPDA